MVVLRFSIAHHHCYLALVLSCFSSYSFIIDSLILGFFRFSVFLFGDTCEQLVQTMFSSVGVYTISGFSFLAFPIPSCLHRISHAPFQKWSVQSVRFYISNFFVDFGSCLGIILLFIGNFVVPVSSLCLLFLLIQHFRCLPSFLSKIFIYS